MTGFPDKAMVLAAGLGLRMRPLTEHTPKPLIEVAGRPIIDRILDWLSASGVKEAVVNTHYLADKLASHLAKRSAPAVRISREEIVLETGGGIRRALPLLGAAPFFVVNGDALCIDGAVSALSRLASRWDDGAMDALLLVQRVDAAMGYDGPGDFFLEGEKIRRRGDASGAPFVFTGVQMLHPRFFDGSPEGAFSLNVLYNRDMKADGTLARVRALVHDGKWLHIGDAEGLRAAESFLRKR